MGRRRIVQGVCILLGTGTLCVFVCAITIPSEIKFFDPGHGAPTIYTDESTQPPSPQPSEVPPSTTPPSAPPESPTRLSCEAMRSWDTVDIFAYWERLGRPSYLDNDRDGVPCESVKGERVITPESWPTYTPAPPTIVRPKEEPPATSPPPRANNQLPEANLTADEPIPTTDVTPEGHLVP